MSVTKHLFISMLAMSTSLQGKGLGAKPPLEVLLMMMMTRKDAVTFHAAPVRKKMSIHQNTTLQKKMKQRIAIASATPQLQQMPSHRNPGR